MRLARRGVTLIELLITIMIIGILAAAVLGVAAVAGETAREAKTRVIVGRLHTLLMEHYDSYISRRVRLRPQVLAAINDLTGTNAEKGQAKARARLYALREMILMEVPERWSDILLAPVSLTQTPLYPRYLDPSSSNGRTELSNLYLRNLRRIAAAKNKITGNNNTLDQLLENQSAECLYLVIMNACGDGEARTLVPESSIGDTDGDGAKEFLDGWGHPIAFFRWAPGFESDVQVNANEFGPPPPSNPPPAAWVSAANLDHDQYDLYRADTPAFRIVPLIYSPGRDEEYGLLTAARDNTMWLGIPNLNTTVSDPSLPALLPWRHYTNGGDNYYLGTADGSKTDVDNIHNHLIRTR